MNLETEQPTFTDFGNVPFADSHVVSQDGRLMEV
jgi:hypothetical protein